MSRFKGFAPRSHDISQSIASSTSPEDEIITSILREREQRIIQSPSPGLNARASDTSSAASADSGRLRPLGSPAIKSTRFEGAATARTPYNTLKRLASVDAQRDGQTEGFHMPVATGRGSYAESYVSHTTSSINEVAAILESEESLGTHESPKASLFLSNHTSQERPTKNEEATEPIRVKPPPPRIEPQVRADQDRIKPNRTLFTPLSVAQGRPRSREVASGYMSPPHSRHTSPEDANLHKALRRAVSLDGSPSPTSNRKIPDVPNHLFSRPIEGGSSRAASDSPRSKLSRTLADIQAELADSRESMDLMTSRVDTLEQHRSLDRIMLERHVADCTRNIADEMKTILQRPGTPDGAIADIESEDSEGADAESEYAALEPSSILRSSSISTTKDGLRLRLRLTLPVKILLCGVCAALAAEWLVIAVLSELGRRQVLVLS